MKSKEAKLILNNASERLKVNVETILGSKTNVEVVEAGFGHIYLANGKPLFFKVGENVLPTLFFGELSARMPKIVVDMGAVPYVCKGADVMAPGVVKVEGEFRKGDIVAVVDQKYGKRLALGESLQDSETMKAAKKGAMVRNMHYVSDKIWDLAKTIGS